MHCETWDRGTRKHSQSEDPTDESFFLVQPMSCFPGVFLSTWEFLAQSKPGKTTYEMSVMVGWCLAGSFSQLPGNFSFSLWAAETGSKRLIWLFLVDSLILFAFHLFQHIEVMPVYRNTLSWIVAVTHNLT